VTVGARVRVEIVSRNAYWRNAVAVEWASRFPERPLAIDATGHCAVDREWVEELELVAASCFSRVAPAPADPGRRRLFRRLLAPGGRREMGHGR
jgi:hypothetical protein